MSVFIFGPVTVYRKPKMHSTHGIVCQVLNMEVDLSWYEQPSRRSHLDQSMFFSVFKMANKCEVILLDQLVAFPPQHPYYVHRFA